MLLNILKPLIEIISNPNGFFDWIIIIMLSIYLLKLILRNESSELLLEVLDFFKASAHVKH